MNKSTLDKSQPNLTHLKLLRKTPAIQPKCRKPENQSGFPFSMPSKISQFTNPIPRVTRARIRKRKTPLESRESPLPIPNAKMTTTSRFL